MILIVRPDRHALPQRSYQDVQPRAGVPSCARLECPRRIEIWCSGYRRAYCRRCALETCVRGHSIFCGERLTPEPLTDACQAADLRAARDIVLPDLVQNGWKRLDESGREQFLRRSIRAVVMERLAEIYALTVPGLQCVFVYDLPSCWNDRPALSKRPAAAPVQRRRIERREQIAQFVVGTKQAALPHLTRANGTVAVTLTTSSHVASIEWLFDSVVRAGIAGLTAERNLATGEVLFRLDAELDA